MLRPEDLTLTPKMISEASALATYPSVTSWTAYGAVQAGMCQRCGRCNEMLKLGTAETPVETKAQHLVTHHGYSYDGLTPEEFVRHLDEL